VNRSVDELYELCEEDEDENKCVEAMELMVDTYIHYASPWVCLKCEIIQERSRKDFQKLIERIQEQKRFELMKGQPSGGISWEVRKPTHTPPKAPTVIIHLEEVSKLSLLA
jgi:hypothetical protein